MEKNKKPILSSTSCAKLYLAKTSSRTNSQENLLNVNSNKKNFDDKDSWEDKECSNARPQETLAFMGYKKQGKLSYYTLKNNSLIKQEQNKEIQSTLGCIISFIRKFEDI